MTTRRPDSTGQPHVTMTAQTAATSGAAAGIRQRNGTTARPHHHGSAVGTRPHASASFAITDPIVGIASAYTGA